MQERTTIKPTCWWTSLRANTTHSTNSRMTYFSLQPFVWLSCFMHLFFVFTNRNKTDDWIVYNCDWTIGHRTQLYALWLIALVALISSKFHGSDWFKCTLNIIGTRFWLWAALIWNWVLYFEWRCNIARFQLSQLAVSDISHHGNRPNGHENMQCDEIILWFFFSFRSLWFAGCFVCFQTENVLIYREIISIREILPLSMFIWRTIVYGRELTQFHSDSRQYFQTSTCLFWYYLEFQFQLDKLATGFSVALVIPTFNRFHCYCKHYEGVLSFCVHEKIRPMWCIHFTNARNFIGHNNNGSKNEIIALYYVRNNDISIYIETHINLIFYFIFFIFQFHSNRFRNGQFTCKCVHRFAN